MRLARLEDMTAGWFLGDFTPSILQTSACEVAVKHYAAGAQEGHHWQATATEVTVVVRGTVRMLGRTLGAGDVILLEPGQDDATGFEAITDATVVAVKLPSLPDDKRVPATTDLDLDEEVPC